MRSKFGQSFIHGRDFVAQLVEQYTFNVWALGSSPSQFTKLRRKSELFLCADAKQAIKQRRQSQIQVQILKFHILISPTIEKVTISNIRIKI